MGLRDGRLVVCPETDEFNGLNTWVFLQHLEAQSREAGRQVVVMVNFSGEVSLLAGVRAIFAGSGHQR